MEIGSDLDTKPDLGSRPDFDSSKNEEHLTRNVDPNIGRWTSFDTQSLDENQSFTSLSQLLPQLRLV